jgi:hypothetical protein
MNPSFEENAGTLRGWEIEGIAGQGPDLPPLDNTNPYGPRTPFGDYFAGKVTQWLSMNFRMGQVIEVQDVQPEDATVEWSFSAHANLYSRNSGEGHPESVHQDWEVGWMNDGSEPPGIDACDNYVSIVELDGSFTNNDLSGFHKVEREGSMSAGPMIRYLVLRVYVYNDGPFELSVNNFDKVSFSARAVGGENNAILVR